MSETFFFVPTFPSCRFLTSPLLLFCSHAWGTLCGIRTVGSITKQQLNPTVVAWLTSVSVCRYRQDDTALTALAAASKHFSVSANALPPLSKSNRNLIDHGITLLLTFLFSIFHTIILLCFFLLIHPYCSHARGILCGIHASCILNGLYFSLLKLYIITIIIVTLGFK